MAIVAIHKTMYPGNFLLVDPCGLPRLVLLKEAQEKRREAGHLWDIWMARKEPLCGESYILAYVLCIHI